VTSVGEVVTGACVASVGLGLPTGLEVIGLEVIGLEVSGLEVVCVGEGDCCVGVGVVCGVGSGVVVGGSGVGSDVVVEDVAESKSTRQRDTRRHLMDL
jgi:hypothetical protein